MSELKERIKTLRESTGLSQTKFGERIGVTLNSIASYEKGRRTPSDSVITLMCHEFKINKDWLFHGKGPMKTETNKDIAHFIGGLLANDKSEFKARFIAALARMSSEQWQSLNDFMADFYGEKENEDG